jgi:hypothetical protein
MVRVQTLHEALTGQLRGTHAFLQVLLTYGVNHDIHSRWHNSIFYTNLLFCVKIIQILNLLKLLSYSNYSHCDLCKPTWNCCYKLPVFTFSIKNLLNVVLKIYFVKPSMNTTHALITDDKFLYTAFQYYSRNALLKW